MVADLDIYRSAKTELLALTTEIIAAYVSKNAVAVDQIPSLIKEVHQGPGESRLRG